MDRPTLARNRFTETVVPDPATAFCSLSPAEPPAAEGPWRGHTVLVVDDEPGMCSFIERALSTRGCTVMTAASAEQGALQVAQVPVDAIILDIALPGKSGIAWLRELRDSGFGGEVILITAFADLETAIDALRAGASDFILKPFRVDQILNALQRCLDRSRLSRENFVLRREVADLSGHIDGVVGCSPAMDRVCMMIKRIAPTPSTVLLLGESGVGKEVAARALHQMSPRAKRPFVPVNCGAISAELIESELFGHVRGAFSGAKDNRNGLFYYANGGTLFLDEIGELPPALQTKLLRVLEERRIRPVGTDKETPVDVRVLAATNRDLKADVQAGRFRADLYYRVEVVTLTIPPLRHRPEDIPVLAGHFNEVISARLGVPPLPATTLASRQLRDYGWPGNVRELRNLIERSLILGRLAFRADAEDAADTSGDRTLAAVEKAHILRVLAQCEGNKSRAADVLAVSRKTMERKCREWGQ